MSPQKSLHRGVLVVEDDAALRGLFGVMLEAEGYEVFQAENGQAGLEMLKSHSSEINVVITDLGLPRIGGVELISRVRQVHPGVKIIGTSGFGARAVRESVLAAGADDFVAKPFSLPDVIGKVKALSP
ncbi:MAG: response regulator [Bacteroidota bacterium]